MTSKMAAGGFLGGRRGQVGGVVLQVTHRSVPLFTDLLPHHQQAFSDRRQAGTEGYTGRREQQRPRLKDRRIKSHAAYAVLVPPPLSP
ncbi:unnamed protein product [Boreogadus saida]